MFQQLLVGPAASPWLWVLGLGLLSLAAAPAATPAAAASHHGSDHVPVPGTVILALALFVSFVLYYFVNWKYLSEVWLLS